MLLCVDWVKRGKGLVLHYTFLWNSLFTFFLDKKNNKKGQGKKRRLFFSNVKVVAAFKFSVEKKPWIKFHSTLCCSGGAAFLWKFVSLTPGNAIPFIFPLSLLFAGYSSLNLSWYSERLRFKLTIFLHKKRHSKKGDHFFEKISTNSAFSKRLKTLWN